MRLNVPYIDERELEEIAKMLATGYLTQGPKTAEFERLIAEYIGCRYAFAMSSCTTALHLALVVLDVGTRDEVLVPDFTFPATANVVVQQGAVPVLVDIDLDTFTVNLDDLRAKISPRTRAVLPVHTFGCSADMDPIMALAAEHGVPVIEDAACAIGTTYRGRFCGNIGTLGCFSFFPSKNLGGFGDGGMVTTNDPALAERVKWLRNHGMNPKYYHKYVGGNFRLDALQAAVLRVKLPYLDGWTAGRQRNADRYRRLFAEAGLIGEIGLPNDLRFGRHIYNQFVIRTGHRDAAIASLKERKIGHEIYYPVPLHLQECFADLGYRAGAFPHSEAAAQETLALPIYPELTEEMQAAVVGAVAHAYQ